MLNTSVLFQRSHTTCVRGICVLLIAIFHVLLTWDGMPRYINLIGSVCVAAFLFLSGYGIHESYKKSGLTNYWFKRFKRIIIPYTLFITVLIPFTDDFSWRDYVLDITYFHSSYWFIEFIVWNYAVYWIAQRFFQKHLLLVFLLFGILFLNVLMQCLFLNTVDSFQALFFNICLSILKRLTLAPGDSCLLSLRWLTLFLRT